MCKRRLVSLLVFWIFSSPASAELVPEKALYPTYIADPLRPTFNAQLQRYNKSTLGGIAGDSRNHLKMGGSLLLYGSEWSDLPWQLVLLSGFHGQFDNTQSQDNIGWDGIYGLHIAVQLDSNLALRFGSKHISAHIGDEIIERTGRTRINYTREELRLGLAWQSDNDSLVYAEAGRAYDLRNKGLQQRDRLQLGIQYDSPNRLWGSTLNGYAAMDISAYEENDWDENITVQIGLRKKSGQHTWRTGFEFYDGRSQLGEYFQEQEQYISLGLWLDI